MKHRRAQHNPQPKTTQKPVAIMLWPLVLTLLLMLAGCQTAPQKNAGIDRNIQGQLAQQVLARRLPIPVRGVLPQQLKDTWGAARSNGRRHEGIDIFAPTGTPVVATSSGVVQKISSGGAGGNAVWLLGAGLSRHYYAHLDRVANLRVGDTVRQGQTIGTVGNTGNAQAGRPHLHYGLYLADGGAVNPYPYFLR